MHVCSPDMKRLKSWRNRSTCAINDRQFSSRHLVKTQTECQCTDRLYIIPRQSYKRALDAEVPTGRKRRKRKTSIETALKSRAVIGPFLPEVSRPLFLGVGLVDKGQSVHIPLSSKPTITTTSTPKADIMLAQRISQHSVRRRKSIHPLCTNQ